MRAEKYIVIGIYAHEQNSYIPGGDMREAQAGFRTKSAAARSLDRIHSTLGGASGGKYLCELFVRGESGRARKKWLRENRENQESYSNEDYFLFGKYVYHPIDIWDSHEIVHDQVEGMVLSPKS